MYRNLSEYIERLERAGELVRVDARVDPLLEIAEITDRVSKLPGGGKALLFENTGTGFPVLTNMTGSSRRICMALGVDSLDEVGKRIDGLFASLTSPKPGWGDKLRMLPVLAGMSKWLPREVSGRGECQQVVHMGGEADLGILPVLKCWPHDGGRFVTLPLVHTVDPHTGVRNVGMYRMQVTGPKTTGMHWHVHKTGERHYNSYKELGRRMPVSVCLGGDPVYTYAATAPVPDGIDEYLLAGFLRQKPVKLVKCLTNNLMVPSDCDIVIEGYVDPEQEKFMEGPFGDHTGFYSLEDLYPEFHITAITHRRGAVYPATLVGVPPQEDAYIAEATEKIFLAPIKLALQPEIADLHMPVAGVAHNLAIVSIKSTYPGQALKVAASMWGAGQMMFNKILLISPEGTDIRDPEKLAPLIRGVNLRADLLFSRGVLDVLDHSSPVAGVGGKLSVDLTGPGVRSGRNTAAVGNDIPEKVPGWNGAIDWSLLDKWAAVVLRCPPEEEINVTEITWADWPPTVKFLLLSDCSTASLKSAELLWHALANTDPARDVTLAGERLLIDARTKLPGRDGNPLRTPNVVASSRETVELVDSRLPEYGIEGLGGSPSERYRLLAYGDGAEMCRARDSSVNINKTPK